MEPDTATGGGDFEMIASDVATALKILNIWYGTWEKYRSNKKPMYRRFAIRQKAVGIVNHDRALLGRRLFVPDIKTKF